MPNKSITAIFTKKGMVVRQICEVKNNQLSISLPVDFKDKKKVLVIVDDAPLLQAKKQLLMKKAALDPLFLADIKEISDDFNAIENGNL